MEFWSYSHGCCNSGRAGQKGLVKGRVALGEAIRDNVRQGHCIHKSSGHPPTARWLVSNVLEDVVLEDPELPLKKTGPQHSLVYLAVHVSTSIIWLKAFLSLGLEPIARSAVLCTALWRESE